MYMRVYDQQKKEAVQKLEFLMQHAKAPLVDMIVVNYNYGRYVKQCMESIDAQDYPEWRCTIVDNSSTDDSPATIEAYISDKTNRFNLIRSEENLGQMGAMKLAFQATQGDFVVFVDSDDVLLPNFVAVHLAAHFYGDVVSFTSSNMAVIGPTGATIEGAISAFGQGQSCLEYGSAYRYFAGPSRWSPTSGLMFRRPVLGLIFPEDTKAFVISADYYLCRFATLLGGHLLIPEILALYRRHDKNFNATPFILGRGSLAHNPERALDRRMVKNSMAAHMLDNLPTFVPLLTPRMFLMRFAAIADTHYTMRLMQCRIDAGLSRNSIVRAWLGSRVENGFRRILELVNVLFRLLARTWRLMTK
jgi:glycosyltransferase involved in cell wall biosynthesis